MARIGSVIAWTAFWLYSIVAIGAFAIAAANPPWERNMDALRGFGALLVAAAPWSIVFMYVSGMLEGTSLDLLGGKSADAVFSAINVGFVFLNVSLLYLLARKQARKGASRDLHSSLPRDTGA